MAGAFAQQSQPPAPAAKSDSPKESGPALGPATRKTKAEIDDAANKAAVPAAMVTAAPIDPNSYVIGPEDILMISVWGEPDFSRGVQVRPDGKFTLPLVGDMVAAGLTPNKLASDVAEALTKYINKPEVMVSLQSVQSKRFYITGEVNRTGTFPLIVPITVLEALTNAGGFRDYAKKNKIVIMRGTERLKFNYNEVIKGKNLAQNILVKNGDYIVVP
jgi:polysaccharide export outer membrane protein